MILSLQQGLAQDGFKVSLVKLCQWFDMPRRTVYYRSTKAPPKVQEHLVKPIKAMIEEENPSFGYRTVAHLLGYNKNAVQRIFQLKSWQVRKRPVGLQAPHPGIALCGQGARRTLGHRFVPRVDRSRWLGFAGSGD